MFVETMDQLIAKMLEQQASDLHINAGSPPIIRVDGRLVPMENYPQLTAEDTKALALSVLNEEQKSILENSSASELDFSFGLGKVGRIRANVYVQKGSYAVALRYLALRIPTFADLGLPEVLNSLCEKPNGLILVTGPTGHGKSTTLASMLECINQTYQRHIITIEDPIEYVYRSKKCLVSQREVHVDTATFHSALRTILRQDPDVVLLGEMRDAETITAALTLAETGHLTFATLHTNSAVETITRIIDSFEPAKQTQVRTQLSFVLAGVLAQQLIPRCDGPGRALALEIMVPSQAIRNLIREGKIHQIQTIIQTSQSSTIMRTMNVALWELYTEGKISKEDMMHRSPDIGELQKKINML